MDAARGADAVARLALPAATKAALVGRGRLETAADVLVLSPPELEKRAGVSRADATAAVAAAAAYVAGGVRGETLAELAARVDAEDPTAPGRLSVGDFVLDRFLRGGLLVPGVTELSGESATGKTQLCLQLCLAVQLPPAYGGLAAGALYVSTEDAFPMPRLHHMLAAFAQRHDVAERATLTDRIYVEHVGDSDSLDVLLHTRLPKVCMWVHLVA
jgi:DNA-repair protein XRCC3